MHGANDINIRCVYVVPNSVIRADKTKLDSSGEGVRSRDIAWVVWY